MTTASTSQSAAGGLATDPLQLIDVDHVRFYVGNAKQAAFFYAHTFGFQVSQIADLTTCSQLSPAPQTPDARRRRGSSGRALASARPPRAS